MKHLTESRAKLRDAATAKRAAQDDVHAAQIRLDRLAEITKAVAPARQALGAHDAEQADKFASWSASNDAAAAPKPDAPARAALVAAVAEAEIAAAAAERAKSGPNADATAAAQQVADATAGASVWAKCVLCEEATALLPEMAKAIAHAEDLRHQLDAARAAVFDHLDPSDDANRPALTALAAFNEARRIAESRPHEPEENPHRAEWLRLAMALTANPETTADDLDEIALPPVPAMPEMRDFDQVSALARAVASFPTTSLQVIR